MGRKHKSGANGADMAWARPVWAALGLGAWLTLLPSGVALAAQPAYDEPFDETKILVPDDVDSLGLEDSVARAAREDAGALQPVRLHPLAMLMLNAPFAGDPPTGGGMLQADVILRAGMFGAQATPRLRLTDVRHPLASTTVMLQQGFLFLRVAGSEIKVGKVLSQFGRVWDYGFYGPLVAGADMKLVPDLGASFEMSQTFLPSFSLDVAGQYYWVDGRAFSVRNDTLFTLRHARRKNMAGLRVVPVWHLGRQNQARLSLGASGQHYTATQPAPHPIWRGAVDVAVDHPWVGAFAEVGAQWGQDQDTDNNVPIAPFRYLWTGVEGRVAPFALRYHFNIVHYGAPYPALDTLHQPGAEYTVTPKLSLLLEGAFWRSNQQDLPRGENSLYLVAFYKL